MSKEPLPPFSTTPPVLAALAHGTENTRGALIESRLSEKIPRLREVVKTMCIIVASDVGSIHLCRTRNIKERF